MLASIQIVREVEKHPNADQLDVIKVLGWQLVAKLGEFKVGDKCVYIEIDTVVPSDNPNFAFLASTGFRVRTIKLRGAMSQGIAFPLTILPKDPDEYIVGQDVSSVLDVTHYEKPVPISMGGLVRGNFPFGLPKTDEERIENIPEIINEIQGKMVYIAQKLDGCLMEDTIIETPTGKQTIKILCETKYRGQVLSYDLYKRKNVWVDVTNTFINNECDGWYEIICDDDTKIYTTGNHLVWIDDLKCWRAVKDLVGGEKIIKS